MRLKIEVNKAKVESEHRLCEKEAWRTLHSLLRRWESNSIRLEDIDIIRRRSNENGR